MPVTMQGNAFHFSTCVFLTLSSLGCFRLSSSWCLVFCSIVSAGTLLAHLLLW